MIPTPAWLARRLAERKPYARPTTDRQLTVRRPYAEPKPPPPVRIDQPPIRVYTPPDIQPPRTWFEAEITLKEIYREAAVLDQLAKLTDRTDPWTAAMRLFGGRT